MTAATSLANRDPNVNPLASDCEAILSTYLARRCALRAAAHRRTAKVPFGPPPGALDSRRQRARPRLRVSRKGFRPRRQMECCFMAQNFIDCGREQVFLMPPSLRDWLPEDHLAWFVLATIDGVDLGAFYAAYRADGHGRAAYDPRVLVALLVYAYSTGVFSSRGMERCCRQDVAYRVITANRVPDHATIARFVCRHEAALGELFGSVLELCARAGLVASGVVAIDGSKVEANASRDAMVDYDQIARELVAHGREVDEAEDEQYGEDRGDELPGELATEEGRRAWLARELAAQRERKQHQRDRGNEGEDEHQQQHTFDARKIFARVQGREGWLREARRQLDRDRWCDAAPIPRGRIERLWEAGQRMDADLAAEIRGNHAYEHERATGRDRSGRRYTAKPKPFQVPATPEGKINLTDPDARVVKARQGFCQGYNAQVAVNEAQIVLAAEITPENVDFSRLAPMVRGMLRELEIAGGARPDAVLADAGFWNEEHMDEITGEHGIPVLIPPDSHTRKGARPGWTGGRYAFMRRVLSTDLGREIYRKRKQTVEPVFGHTKRNRNFTHFHRRGRAAVRAEWRLLMATHNVTKLYHHHLATIGP
jgi:transposase